MYFVELIENLVFFNCDSLRTNRLMSCVHTRAQQRVPLPDLTGKLGRVGLLKNYRISGSDRVFKMT